ncbi:MAG TPA: hypothetical protein VFM15_09590, partial [Gammaproteobacteria bacterium]|nr:hypothetical protein [Gammaproteobacteria bacterium]
MNDHQERNRFRIAPSTSGLTLAAIDGLAATGLRAMLRCSSRFVPTMTPQDPSSASPDRDPVRAEKNQPADRESVRTAGSTEGMPVAPALGASLDRAKMPLKSTLVDRRILLISALSIVLGAAAAGVAQLLMLMINLITDLVFYGRISDVLGPNARHGSFVLSPAGNHLGAFVILMPVIGG